MYNLILGVVAGKVQPLGSIVPQVVPLPANEATLAGNLRVTLLDTVAD